MIFAISRKSRDELRPISPYWSLKLDRSPA
jgi:hypothetical protein